MKIENMDISKLKTNNKCNNIHFLLKDNIFEILCYYTNNCVDTSVAYIPWFDQTTEIEHKNGEKEILNFIAPCEENNYADLSFINNGKYTNVKACRVKTLSAICMDGNLLTYDKNIMNNDTLFLFYSINPNETNHVLLMSAEIYNFFVSHNNNDQMRYFDTKYTDKIKQAFGFKDSQLLLIDCTKEIEMEECEKINIRLKQNACLKTYWKIINDKSKNGTPKIQLMKTHFGKQYSAYNLISGEIRNFRDSHARNNFFKSIGIKLSDDHNIRKNCKNMKFIVEGKQVDSYRTNIMENGWVICDYMANTSSFIDFLQKLISILNTKSKKLTERLKKIASLSKQNIILITQRIKEKVKQMKEKMRGKFTYYRPFSLLEYVVNGYNSDMSEYFRKNPHLIKLYC